MFLKSRIGTRNFLLFFIVSPQKHHMTTQELIDYLDWINGPCNPIDHNDFFNGIAETGDLEQDWTLYTQRLRDHLILKQGQALAPLLLDVLKNHNLTRYQINHDFAYELAWWVKRFLVPAYPAELNAILTQELALPAPRLLIVELMEAMDPC